MYEDMTLSRNIDPGLYRLLRIASYINWPAHDPEGSESRELFWRLLRESLPRVPLTTGGGMASSNVSLPELDTAGMMYNADEEELWPLPPKRERLFQSRRQSNTTRRDMITPAARRQRDFDRQEQRRQREEAEMERERAIQERRHGGRHHQNRPYDPYDPNRVLII